MICVSLSGPLGGVNHDRIVEDLRSMSGVFLEGKASAPLALLADLGGDLLYAKRNDPGAWRLRRNEELHRLLASLTYKRAFEGALRVSWLHLTLALGRKDLHSHFLKPGRCDLEAAMKWLVLYGMDEHRLWRFLDRRFVADLRRRSIKTRHGALSPLDLILLAERPDLRGAAPLGSRESTRSLDAWVERNGVHEYKLFWALDEASYARIAAAPPPDLPGSGAPFAAALGAAHASGRLDVYVAKPAETARRLEGVSQMTAAEREAALRPPTDDTLPLEDDVAALVRPTPLTGDFVCVFDFLPGDKGLATTMAGVFGRANADGLALISPHATFFFAPPTARRLIVVVDARLADAGASLLVRIDGQPADVFSAAALASRAAKVHALAGGGRPGLTVELECLGGSAAGPQAWLRSLALVIVPN